MDRVIALELEILGSHGMAAHAYPPMLEAVRADVLRPDDVHPSAGRRARGTGGDGRGVRSRGDGDPARYVTRPSPPAPAAPGRGQGFSTRADDGSVTGLRDPGIDARSAGARGGASRAMTGHSTKRYSAQATSALSTTIRAA